jgi:hypothetical protein
MDAKTNYLLKQFDSHEKTTIYKLVKLRIIVTGERFCLNKHYFHNRIYRKKEEKEPI